MYTTSAGALRAGRIGVIAAALMVCAELAAAVPAHADPLATVKVRTQRMSDANLGAAQDGWYNVGDQLTLVCWKRGQPVKGDDLWYRASDSHYVAAVDIQTGAGKPVGSDCGAGTPAADVSSGRTMGARRASNSGAPGQCTWGALQKWFENAGYYPDITGDAKDWVDSARAHGWTVVNGAQDRSIVVFTPGLPGVDVNGHSAWVNSVSQRPDGLWINITEMNNASYGGVGAWWTRDVKDEPGMSYILMP
jgi:surface antigen